MPISESLEEEMMHYPLKLEMSSLPDGLDDRGSTSLNHGEMGGTIFNMRPVMLAVCSQMAVGLLKIVWDANGHCNGPSSQGWGEGIREDQPVFPFLIESREGMYPRRMAFIHDGHSIISV